MAQHLKRWESPRKSGRNDKGRGGTARQRQLQKRQQTLRKRLNGRPEQNNQTPPREQVAPFFIAYRLPAELPIASWLGPLRWSGAESCCQR
nr:hypothetical protein [Nodosilinea sp. TSF1-S3]